MNIDCIITCVDYGDFLSETLPHVLPHFDRVLVLTSSKDKYTQETCRRLSCPYIATEYFFKNGDKFNKARGIDYGIANARYNDWIIHLDADTYLPPMTRKWLEWRHLDENCIYGIDRVECVGYDNWKKFESEHHLQHDYMCRVKIPENLRLLHRIAIRDYGGYIPIGYFQMWHASHGRRYPIAEKSNAERTDVLHAIQWSPENRILIPEIIGVHLRSHNGPLGENWNGRQSPRFGPNGVKGISVNPNHCPSGN